MQFDHRSAAFARDMAAISEELRRGSPIAYSESHGGFWIVSTYELVRAVLADEETFSSARTPDGGGGASIPPLPITLFPAELDIPNHDRLRRAINPLFARGAVEKLRPEAEAIVAAALDDVIEQRDFDAVRLANHVPAALLLRYLGFPREGQDQTIDAVLAVVDTSEDDPTAAMQSFANFFGMVQEMVALRRKEPDDDIISYLTQLEEPVISEEELLWMLVMLTIAGIDTTGALISNSMVYLEEDRQIRKRLIAESELIGPATDEFLRFSTPGGVTLARTVTREVTLGGEGLKPGDRVLAIVWSANRDEKAFETPEKLNLDRRPNGHLSFSIGNRYCVGSAMGKLEFQVFLAGLLDRIPNFSIDLEQARRGQDLALVNRWLTLPATTNA
jgi:cytochrome P450